MNILIVDDDQFANTLAQYALSREGHDVETMDNPRSAMQRIKQEGEPDLLILDVAMPYMSGFEFAEQLRHEGSMVPIIFLTAQDSIEAKVKGFNLGADDYICKPYNHQELIVRVEALRRRLKAAAGATLQQPIQSGQVTLFPKELKVEIVGRDPVILTPTEAQVLRILMENTGRVVKRDTLLKDVWNDSADNSNIVDVYIRRLRLKLERDSNNPQYIHASRGIGYKFTDK